jgi:predicted aldo/keto reductase-like oxidoreductase
MLLYKMSIADHGAEGQDELLATCVRNNVGVVVMKAYGGGKLLKEKPTPGLTPVHCLSYVLSRPGVTSVVPGVKSLEELKAALAYLDASPEERDFSAVLKTLSPDLAKGCVYCNHCLPCPQGIDIGRVSRLLDMQRNHPSVAVKREYAGLKATASDCVECASCEERCPWGVDVVETMQEAKNVFGG